MTKRQAIWVGVAILFFIAGGLLWTLFKTHTVVLTEDYIQERVNIQIGKEFSVKGKGRLLIKTVTLKNATVHIAEGRVVALLDLEGKAIAGKKFSLTTYAIGAPYYANGKFYFKPDGVVIQRFAYQGSTPTEYVERFAKHVPWKRVQQFIADKAPEIEEWMINVAESAATHTLAQRPVFVPKNDIKGILIRASLESIVAQEDRIMLTFTLWQLTLTVAYGVIVLLVAIVIACVLVINPLF